MIWLKPEYAAFRERVRKFEFSPCTDCGGCDSAEKNEDDSSAIPFPFAAIASGPVAFCAVPECGKHLRENGFSMAKFVWMMADPGEIERSLE